MARRMRTLVITFPVLLRMLTSVALVACLREHSSLRIYKRASQLWERNLIGDMVFIALTVRPLVPQMELRRSFLPLRKSTETRVRGIFVYDETGRWLATTEHVDFAGLNNSGFAVLF